MSEATARRVVYARSGGRCELCGATATDWAHRRSRAQGGQWAPSNGLHLCRPCHAWTELNPAAASAGGWRLVHDLREPASVPVWLQPVQVWPGWWLVDDEGLYVAYTAPGVPVLPSWVRAAA